MTLIHWRVSDWEYACGFPQPGHTVSTRQARFVTCPDCPDCLDRLHGESTDERK